LRIVKHTHTLTVHLLCRVTRLLHSKKWDETLRAILHETKIKRENGIHPRADRQSTQTPVDRPCIHPILHLEEGIFAEGKLQVVEESISSVLWYFQSLYEWPRLFLCVFSPFSRRQISINVFMWWVRFYRRLFFSRMQILRILLADDDDESAFDYKLHGILLRELHNCFDFWSYKESWSNIR